MKLPHPPIILVLTPSSTLGRVAWASILVGIVCAAVVTIDIVTGRRQPMRIMNVVWPLTSLYGSVLALAAYFRFGRAMRSRGILGADRVDHMNHEMNHSTRPMPVATVLSTTHCGAGCMLGDILAEGGLFVLGGAALLGSPLLTSYVFDFIAAYIFGILFQYFAIASMRHLSAQKTLVQAIKADTLSLVAFQIGMYAWMAFYQKLLFHDRLKADSPIYWFMMQLGMLAGFLTSYPMNWLLIRRRIKESM